MKSLKERLVELRKPIDNIMEIAKDTKILVELDGLIGNIMEITKCVYRLEAQLDYCMKENERLRLEVRGLTHSLSQYEKEKK